MQADPVGISNFEELLHWYASPGARSLDIAASIQRVCLGLRAAGSTVWRVRILRLTKHPEVSGIVYHWQHGRGVEVSAVPHDLLQSSSYLGSPVQEVIENRTSLRLNLAVPEVAARYPQLDEFVTAGVTDYVAEPLYFSDGRVSCATVATRASEGFRDDEMAVLDKMLPLIALKVDVHSKQHALESLLAAYLGKNAAQRVLAGEFRRGRGEIIQAAIWFADLRGFTHMSDHLGARELVQILDRYHEVVVGAVEEQGGEVLKFVGDGTLAVFPFDDEAQGAARSALDAAIAVQNGLERLNPELTSVGAPRLKAGIGIHLGEVVYGNVGSRSRLDFTVIGKAVNAASRIEGLTKVVKEPLLLSEAVAQALGDSHLRDLGEHVLAGTAAPMRIFAPV